MIPGMARRKERTYKAKSKQEAKKTESALGAV